MGARRLDVAVPLMHNKFGSTEDAAVAPTFKNEKQFDAWLAENPSAVKRMQVQKAAAAAQPALREAAERMRDLAWPNNVAVSQPTSVVVRLPTRSAPRDHYVTFATKFDRAMAWFFVGVTSLSALGIVATMSAILALEYLR